jgi:hypothetical protein
MEGYPLGKDLDYSRQTIGTKEDRNQGDSGVPAPTAYITAFAGNWTRDEIEPFELDLNCVKVPRRARESHWMKV